MALVYACVAPHGSEAIEQLASWIIHHEHCLSALAHQFQRPQCISTVQVALKFIFVRETIDAFQSQLIYRGRDGYECVLLALSVIRP
jgi:hypothetical protein